MHLPQLVKNSTLELDNEKFTFSDHNLKILGKWFIASILELKLRIVINLSCISAFIYIPNVPIISFIAGV